MLVFNFLTQRKVLFLYLLKFKSTLYFYLYNSRNLFQNLPNFGNVLVELLSLRSFFIALKKAIYFSIYKNTKWSCSTINTSKYRHVFIKF